MRYVIADMFVAPQSTPKCAGWEFVPNGKRGNPECFLKDSAGTISPAVHAPCMPSPHMREQAFSDRSRRCDVHDLCFVPACCAGWRLHGGHHWPITIAASLAIAVAWPTESARPPRMQILCATRAHFRRRLPLLRHSRRLRGLPATVLQGRFRPDHLVQG